MKEANTEGGKKERPARQPVFILSHNSGGSHSQVLRGDFWAWGKMREKISGTRLTCKRKNKEGKMLTIKGLLQWKKISEKWQSVILGRGKCEGKNKLAKSPTWFRESAFDSTVDVKISSRLLRMLHWRNSATFPQQSGQYYRVCGIHSQLKDQVS